MIGNADINLIGVCIASENNRMDDLETAMVDLGVNYAFFTPTVARLLSLKRASGLEIVALGGEAVDDDLVQILIKEGLQVFVVYGPTEASIWAHVCPRGEKFEMDIKIPKIGNAIGKSVGSCTWIVNAEDPEIPLPIGAIGE